MLTPKKVMVLDDEQDIVKSISLILESRGYTISGFTSPVKAIEEVRSSSDYTLIISDIRMPGMNGFEFARKARDARSEIPIVLMTSFEINKSEFSLLFPSISVSELIKKPFSNAQLMDIVRKYVGLTEQH